MQKLILDKYLEKSENEKFSKSLKNINKNKKMPKK